MFFDKCGNLNELKAEYKRLVMEHHPDMGGDLETMKRINIEHDERFQELKDAQNREAERGNARETTETPEEFRAVVESLLAIDGIEVELCGSWLWIAGDTFSAKDALKACGCRWSSSKKRWYWRHAEEGDRRGRGRSSMAHIRSKYGSEWLRSGKDREALPA